MWRGAEAVRSHRDRQRFDGDQLLKRNRRARDKRISNLDSWVGSELDEGGTYAGIYTTLAAIIPQLVGKADEERTSLKAESSNPGPLSADNELL
jgi:hypothetical protein